MYLTNWERNVLDLAGWGCDVPVGDVQAALTATLDKRPELADALAALVKRTALVDNEDAHMLDVPTAASKSPRRGQTAAAAAG